MNQQAGFSIIEVIVAILIVSVGILGVAGLQVVSLQQNRNALLRDQALQLGNDIIDRMRANPLTDYAPVAIDDPPSAASDCINNSCDRNEMAGFDVAQWKCNLDPLDESGDVYDICATFGILSGTLPGGKGSISKDVNGVHEVTVEWINDREGNTSSIILRTVTDND